MKEVWAVIRMNKVTQTKKALIEKGFNGLTAMKVMGRGHSLRDLDKIPDVEDKHEEREMLLESMLKGGRLIPKRLLLLVVPDEDVKKAVETVIEVNQEGHSGDGKIFVLPVADAARVRTGDRGEEAI
ncbi:P-II family nitrogen regulator [Dethiobacter alkaliphilus]|uniref:P-II family nitrogen regulator n=1 Tax=Dethiobacter alkaliphilus TaxID=427926 RepID=UPI00222631C5|nr:P-II family nitrogen regulator [Dethiobacter alkaliphilus]MCW3490784.1 P-II family nitrogen regulator [Dethiobacter alkaliphilus]